MIDAPDHELARQGRRGKTLRVLMLVENNFPADTRVRNEARTLSEAGYSVAIIALRKPGEAFREDVNGVRVYRMPTLTVFRKLGGGHGRLGRVIGKVQSWAGYCLEYGYFTVGCFVLSIYSTFRDGVDVIHAHNPPDTLFTVGVFHRLLGKKFVFDHHDLSPELYLSRFGMRRGEGSIVYKALLMCERLSLRTANVTIATNESYRAIEIDRGRIAESKVFVVRNGPDRRRLREVRPDPDLLATGKSILCYLGAMNPQDGVDYMLRALRHLAFTLKRTDFYCVAIGAGDALEDLKGMAQVLGLSDHVRFTGFIRDEELVRYLSTAHICLDPNPSSPLNDVSTWIKVMEYMAMAKPIVSFDLKETRVTAQDAALYVEPNDELAFARQIAVLMDRPDLRETMGERGKHRVDEVLAWEHVSRNLLDAYAWLGKRSR